MQLLLYLSDFMIPLTIFYIIGYGILTHTDIFDAFIKGAAVGLLVDIYKEYGPDSYEGLLASILMSCSETIFYTISVYFIATGDRDHRPVVGMRWMLAGALVATAAGMITSVIVCTI